MRQLVAVAQKMMVEGGERKRPIRQGPVEVCNSVINEVRKSLEETKVEK